MFDGDDDDDDHDDCASTTTTSPSSSSPDYDDVEILLDRSRKLIVKAKDAECKCSCANREEFNGQSGSEEKANDVGRYDQMSSSSSALRNGGDWKVKEWKAGDNAMTSSSSPLPPLPPHPPVTDDLQSCQSSMTSFVAASRKSRRDASSSSESREELSLLLCQQRSSICGSTTGEKPSRCQRRRHGRPLDCVAGKSNPASDEQKAPVPWRANARCQQVVAPCRPPPQLRSFLSEMADRRCPVINIRRATLYVNSRIGFNREKGKSNGQSTTTKDLAPRQKNRRSDRPKTKTEIQPGPGSFRCHRAPPPRLPSLLRSLELDGDSRYPSPSSPSSASPYPRPSPVSDDLPVERAPEEERVGGNAASSEKSDWKKEKKEEEDEEEESEKCSFKRMLDLTIVCLIVAVVLLSIFSYVFGPSKTKDSDPC